ncbi:MAG: hypothetical protein QOK17_3018 [Sphingomonadales bacterium]|jgi:hypothetical protein|nr:hypothetical protein [Sphingomonadales bacterium]
MAMPARLVFPVPFQRSGYFVRKPPALWLRDIGAGLEAFAINDRPDACSAVLNSFALLLLKIGDVTRSRRLCQLQVDRFLQSGDLLAIQPYINIGRIDFRLGSHASAATHFFLPHAIFPGCRIRLDGMPLTITDPSVANVCETVRLIEGAQLIFSRDGNAAVRIFLRKHLSHGSTAREMMAWFAFHDGNRALLAAETSRLAESTDDCGKLAFYNALNQILARDDKKLFLSLCILLEVLRGSPADRDVIASLLHALKSILSHDMCRDGPCARIRDQQLVHEWAAWLGDAELQAFFDRSPSRSCYESLGGFEHEVDHCYGFAEWQLRSCAARRSGPAVHAPSSSAARRVG